MVSLAIISVGVLGFFGAFSFISKTLHVSRTHTLATNLAQEKIESLKNLTYYELLITTSSSQDNNFSPAIVYDNSHYPPETISIGGITFTRYTFVALAQVDSNVISTVTYTYPDTGMKQITTYVTWADGTTHKKWMLTNLLENPNVNPLDSAITGKVQDQYGNDMVGVQVKIDENPDWNTTTASDGTFSFRVYHGSYTVRASSAGYYDGLSALLDAEAGSTAQATPYPLKITAIATGTVRGNAWVNPDIVISQVAVSTAQADQNGFEVQYIELYNPTTAAINIGANGVNPDLKINYRAPVGCSNHDQCDHSTYGIKLTYISTYVAPSHYYLVANTNTFTINGDALAADAVFTDDANGYCDIPPSGSNWNTGASPPVKKILDVGHGGAVWLQRGSGAIVDAVGWIHNGNMPDYYEGTPITVGGVASYGFRSGENIVRISSPLANFSVSDAYQYGRAYDSGNNAADFAYDPMWVQDITVAPRPTTWATYPPVAGVPAVGAVVASSDPYSGAVTISAAYISSGSYSLLYAPYTLPGVTTGTWQVTVATAGYFNQYGNVTIDQGVSTGVPNGSTSPSWPASGTYSAMLSSSATAGFVKGTVYDINNNALSGLTVSGGGSSKITGSGGGYFLTVSTGSVQVIANPNNLNSQYVQTQTTLSVGLGEVVTQNFLVSKGGSFYGYLTSGTTPLPNYPVTAYQGGNQMGSGTSDTSGVFYIKNLSTGTYTVAPVLEVGQDSSPNSIDSTVVSTGAVWIGTFTVSGALGSITGTVSYNSSLLTTGALLVASTGSISGLPPTIAASTAAALYPIYAISSKADGSYTLPVRGNNTYYMNVYVPTLAGTGSTVNTSMKTYSSIYVTPGASTPKTVTVP